MMMEMRKLALIVMSLACIGGSAAGIYYTHPWAAEAAYATPQESDPYVRFDMEAYDQIAENYWMKPGDYAKFGLPELPQLFGLAISKVSGQSVSPATSTRAATAEMLGTVFATATSTDEKRQWALQTVGLIINSLLPVGRNEVLSSQQQTQLRDTVSNVNPSTDLYSELGVTASATPAQIQGAYHSTKTQLEASTSPQAKQELARASYVHDVLSNSASRAQYDQNGAEPTVFPHILGTTLYIDIDKMSPTTLQEFGRALDSASTTPLSSMIIDLRGNIGGSLDLAPYLIGMFVGQNQYTFDLFHQGDYQTQRSPIPKVAELQRYTELVLLTDGMTQSTAEVFTAAMERFHLATVVGSTTRGWGSVENTYPLSTPIDPSTTYALLLVNSLTLRPDGNPIEGSGVDPDIKTADKNWRSELSQALRSQGLISAVEKTVTQPPLQ